MVTINVVHVPLDIILITMPVNKQAMLQIVKHIHHLVLLYAASV